MVANEIKLIYVYPYFLNSGKHVHSDIPNLIKALKANYLEIGFEILPHFGSGNHIVSAMMEDLKGL